MTQDFDRELKDLFAAMEEPAPEAAFTARVAQEVGAYQKKRKLKRFLFSVLALVALAALAPFLTAMAGQAARLAQMAAGFVLAGACSPAGWAVALLLGLLAACGVRLPALFRWRG